MKSSKPRTRPTKHEQAGSMKNFLWLLLPALLLLLALPSPALAYIGPGAGFALAGSLFAVFAAFLSALLLALTWPARLIWRAFFRRHSLAHSQFKRVVILGLDGLDYRLTEKMLAEGKLPHLDALRRQGCFKPLGTTLPPISPVAWSSFQTGVNPGKHNIYDFLTPDEQTYQPRLSSVEIRPPRRVLRLGNYQIPLGKADVRLLRKSKPFWSVLGECGIFSSVLRVPITFPPEKIRGVLLSAMCVPDLRGTQGTFTHFTTRPRPSGDHSSGDVYPVVRQGQTIRAELLGPQNPLRIGGGLLKVPFVVNIRSADRAVLKINGTKHDLRTGHYTDWITVYFRAAPGVTVRGACKFLLLEASAEFELYVTPINLHPERPAMPVSYPSVYSMYLARKQGPYATLGLAEDTGALNEKVLNDDQFRQQCLDTDREREAMFFDSLDKMARGLCVCVFDGTDRLQHMFWRDLEEDHPARARHPVPQGRNVIEDLYRRMDDLVGRTMARCPRQDTLLMVISDHGFNSFRRGVDLNRWLADNGYLTVHPGRGGEEYLAGVDWSRTQAFALGLAGIFVNVKNKYAHGIVEPGAEAEKLRAEIAERLTGLVDPATGTSAIRKVYIAPKVYRGPYTERGPDLVPGYQRGFRVAWETAVGKTTDSIFHDNTKAWSGDHCIDPALIPGVLFSNHPVTVDHPRLMDIGPTVLQTFGVAVPDYMDGKAFAVGEVAPSSMETPGALTEVA